MLINNLPTQEAALGVRFDFNFGARIYLPAYHGEGIRKMRLTDDLGGKPYEVEFQKEEGIVYSSKCYFTKWRLELFHNNILIWKHDYSCKNKTVLITGEYALGDTIAWMPYIEKFRTTHGCKVIVEMKSDFVTLFQDKYPEIVFRTREGTLADYLAETINNEQSYATYILTYIYEDKENRQWVPKDYRTISLWQMAPYILGLDATKVIRPNINIDSDQRPIDDRYVCIGADASGKFKLWGNPNGWANVVAYLKSKNYRVFVIDKDSVIGRLYDTIDGLEDLTGNIPLPERAQWLAHADLFIGLPSGLAWLAWAVDTPVVMIGGFSKPMTEFENPYRAINYDVCNGCWNDTSIVFDDKDPFWCPRHKDTPRQFECSRSISSIQVIELIDKALNSLTCS